MIADRQDAYLAFARERVIQNLRQFAVWSYVGAFVALFPRWLGAERFIWEGPLLVAALVVLALALIWWLRPPERAPQLDVLLPLTYTISVAAAAVHAVVVGVRPDILFSVDVLLYLMSAGSILSPRATVTAATVAGVWLVALASALLPLPQPLLTGWSFGLLLSGSSTAVLVAIQHERGERRRLRLIEELAHAASHDPLTGLLNRRAMFERAAPVLRGAASDAPCAALFVDADHFKRINDTHGHDAGDAVLAHLAGALSRGCRPDDLVARMGGEEFALLLPATDARGACEAAERLRRSVAEGAPLPFTVSIGVAAWRPGDSFERLCGRADEALYEAKSGGRDRVVLAQRSDDPQSAAS